MVLVTAPRSLPSLPGDSCWAKVMDARLKQSHSVGEWHVDDLDVPSCLLHVLPSDDGRSSRVQLGFAGSSTSAALTLCLAAVASVQTANVTFAAVDRQLVAPLQAALASGNPCRSMAWREQCGLYMPTGSSDSHDAGSHRLPPGATLRALRPTDAETINECWTYRSATSLPMIQSMLSGACAGCVGCEVDGELIGWICRYLDGALGMLFVVEPFRRQGVANALVADAVRALTAARGAPAFCYIVDGNAASRALFEGQGWTRVASADWVGFCLSES